MTHESMLTVWRLCCRWIAWHSIHSTSNMYRSDHLTYRLYLWLYLIAVAGMSINVYYAFPASGGASTANMYIVSFLCIRGLFLLADIIMLLETPEFYKNVIVSCVLLSMVCVPWIVSCVVDPSLRVVLWWTSIALDAVFYNMNILSADYFFHFERSAALNIEV